MRAGSILVRSNIARTTAAPIVSTGTERRLPPNVPTAVRRGATIAARLMASAALEARLALLRKCGNRLIRVLGHATADHVAGLDLARPLERLVERGMHVVLD